VIEFPFPELDRREVQRPMASRVGRGQCSAGLGFHLRQDVPRSIRVKDIAGSPRASYASSAMLWSAQAIASR
jgi:hypothetical protein